mmetsp:Transcript_84299/g.251234  ORF Transcript_84299/g.251234 Transcript_84299/m.251234 type:complete len:200 (-) Transcript_84299:128-727(-)
MAGQALCAEEAEVVAAAESRAVKDLGVLLDLPAVAAAAGEGEVAAAVPHAVGGGHAAHDLQEPVPPRALEVDPQGHATLCRLPLPNRLHPQRTAVPGGRDVHQRVQQADPELRQQRLPQRRDCRVPGDHRHLDPDCPGVPAQVHQPLAEQSAHALMTGEVRRSKAGGNREPQQRDQPQKHLRRQQARGHQRFLLGLRGV